ncbi:hypothetical protein BA896_017750 [Janthinobacterium lividum]|uniref:Uncharacterized protein n=1 Tax=Janthinobacterium lividum TaxID=29581 RepID=A0A1E8PKR3_9BURK|nr:hypothetical protein BA896_017750 [Janthinobacterium lividum]
MRGSGLDVDQAAQGLVGRLDDIRRQVEASLVDKVIRQFGCQATPLGLLSAALAAVALAPLTLSLAASLRLRRKG